jgi:Fe-S oxidoreductase
MSYPLLKSLLVFLALVAAFASFGRQVWQHLWLSLRRGGHSAPLRQWGKRIAGLFVYVAGQWRLFRFLPPGVAHFLIFWGFLLLSLTVLQAIVEGIAAYFNPDFVLPVIGELGPLALVQDIFSLLVASAVLYALYVRLVVNPERYQKSHKGQGVMVLLFILTIMLSLLFMNGARINLGEDAIAGWRPVSSMIGGLTGRLNGTGQVLVREISYWIHLGVVLVFLTELPAGKHFHVVTSLPAVLLRNLEPRGKLLPALQQAGNAGVKAAEQLRWRQMLDLFTCTECGRCQEVCPAHQSGLALSPKTLMMSLRDNLKERGRALNAPDGTSSKILNKELLGDVLPLETIWACTTCYACDQECPLFIEHIAPIVDLRRSLVIDGRLDKELQGSLDNLARYGNSFGQSDRTRAKWTTGLQSPVKDARREPVDYLWFVGDYASYNAALTETTGMVAAVFQKLELDFGILFEGERNAGNDVRRVGEEGLFEMLVEKNMQVMSKCNFHAIVTTDPHTYNALKNEYPWNGNRPKIVHYTELLDELFSAGQLKFARKLNYSVTYHDPCYLGRYNGVYDAPRRLIEATGCKLIEMPRHGDRALCCGAGGGRIWMEEKNVKHRPSESRIREASAIDGIQAFIVSCPKDVTMFRDAAKTTGSEGVLAVKELVELVHEAL